MASAHTILVRSLLSIMSLTLAGCAGVMPNNASNIDTSRQIQGPDVAMDGAKDVIDLQTKGESIILDMVPEDKGEAFPNQLVPPVNVAGFGHIEALRILLEGNNLSFEVRGDVRTYEGGTNGSIRIAAGPLGEVANQLALSGGYFLTVHDKKVVASATKRFVLEVPHVLDDRAAASLLTTVKRLGARDSYLDTIGNTITFEASRTSWRAIDSYLAHMRRSKPMLVYEVEVYQVDLSDRNETEVGWSAISKNLKQDPSTWAVSKSSDTLGSAALALVGKNVSMSAVVNLLQTQGVVSSLSRPRISMLSGSESKFRVGKTTMYVSKITQTSASQTSSTGTAVVTPLQTSSSETAKLKTGFDLTMKGTFQEDTVFTSMKMLISELVQFNDFETFGTKLRLPDTTDKEIETVVRARPGDLILLGGIGSNNQLDTRAGGTAGLSKKTLGEKSEIIVAMRPRVIRFVANKESAL